MSFLDNKIALVTGGTRGIGRAIVDALLAEGATVYFTGRDVKAATRVAQEAGAKAIGLACDVREESQVAAVFDRIRRDAGGLDVLVNNAGIGVHGPVAEMSSEDWHATIETNLNGVFYCTRAAIPLMRARRGGYIVNISSLAGKNPIANMAAYNASKFGLNGFSEALMMELRHDDIRVSYLMPGSVNTGFGGGSAGKDDWALQPQDVAAMVIDLLRSPARALYSRVEMRPSKPPRKG